MFGRLALLLYFGQFSFVLLNRKRFLFVRIVHIKKEIKKIKIN